MKIRELIKQLLDEDPDDEILIDASSGAYDNEVPIEGIRIGKKGEFGHSSILLVPDVNLTSNADINS
jgi:hypothetical protein